MPNAFGGKKHANSGLHKIASENSHLRVVHLLEASRIKTMCADTDISRVLRQYGAEYRELGCSSDPDMKAKLDQYREIAIKRISCIIPHHCGDHENCSYDDCRMIRLHRHFVAKFRVENPDSKATNSEILQDHRKEILEEYVKVAWFNGKVMSMGKRGQATCYEQITKRLDASNIDRVAMAMSSNDCENFFGMLANLYL